ncbi:MAG: hypothetical protein QXZ17_16130, partial [Nitrososphaerota archaeon]
MLLHLCREGEELLDLSPREVLRTHDVSSTKNSGIRHNLSPAGKLFDTCQVAYSLDGFKHTSPKKLEKRGSDTPGCLTYSASPLHQRPKK